MKTPHPATREPGLTIQVTPVESAAVPDTCAYAVQVTGRDANRMVHAADKGEVSNVIAEALATWTNLCQKAVEEKTGAELAADAG